MEPPHSDFRRMAVEEFDTTKLLAHAAKQARERGYDKFPIVDVDSHHYENESLSEILEYMDDPVLRQLALAGSKPNAKNARIMGGLKRSSQHLDEGGCDEHSKAAFRSIGASTIVVTRSTTGGRTM